MSRRDIYYWKCDRPAAFHGTQRHDAADVVIETQLHEELRCHFNAKQVDLKSGASQGNHLTWNADVDGTAMFVRVENGPEQDGHLAIESAVLDRVREIGVLTPRVYACDATRGSVAFAWQALERIAAPDLNHWFKQGMLDVPGIAFEIGQAVAKWQAITLAGFGILEWSAPAKPRSESSVRNEDRETLAPHRGLCGPHSGYADYFHLRLDEHLDFLLTRDFLSTTQRDEILAEIDNHRALLDLAPGCLVHKDLALWNILGTPDQIAAFIDFDDAISGDPMDDLSLLACFHDAAFVRRAFEGYQSIRALPPEHLRRFWLHLLRNMIVKAVIRVGAGYFDRDDGFFLIGPGGSGQVLRQFTLDRLQTALRGLRENADISTL